MDDLVAILNARAPDYARAHAQLDTSGKSIEATLAELETIAAKLFAACTTQNPRASVTRPNKILT
jgi:hypothetical protein